MIDIGCGNGAVTTIAIDVSRAMGARIEVHCADCSSSAVADVRRRMPQVEAVACDALNTPYADGSFDLVVSQFGIEYAGKAAFAEAARLVSASGNLTAIVHLAGGALHRECEENLAAAAAANASNLMPLARAAFAAGFDMLAGRMSVTEFQYHEKRLRAAVETAKRIKAARAIGAFLSNLLRDIEYMLARLRNHAPDKVFSWLDLMAGELTAHEGRMASMTESALDAEAIARVAEDLSAAGFFVDPPQTLSLQETGKPAGWILSARRPDRSL